MAGNSKRKVLVSVFTTIAVLFVLVGAFFIYCGIYYHADNLDI